MEPEIQDDSIRRIETLLEHRDTAELLDIWRTDARREWSEDGLRAIANVLVRRLGALPPPTETDEQRHARARRLLDQATRAETANRSREAWQHIQAAVSLAPDLAEAHVSMGRYWDRRGDLVAAIRSYRQALRLDPGLDEAREDLAGATEDRRELARQGYGVAAPQEVWDAELEPVDEVAPDWVYLDGPAMQCPGRPGYRTRSGRGGLDPIDTNCEQGYMVGLWLRQLVTLKLRPRHPLYQASGLVIGLFGILPLLVAVFDIPGDGYNPIRLACTAMYWVPGLLLIVNIGLSVIRPDRRSD